MPSAFGKFSEPPRLLCVIGFAVFVSLAGLWTLPPLDRDESRFAQATAQMLETGDFITIRFQGKERNKKPVGIHWLQAASVAMFSNVEAREIWAYRLPSFLGVVLAAVFTYLSAKRLYDRRTAFLAALLLASAPVVAVEATIAKTDAVLLAAICLAQYAFIEIYARFNTERGAGWRWPIVFWTAQGAGILIKGPIAPMVSALTGLGLAAAKRRLNWFRAMRPLTGLAIVLLMAAPWAILVGAATDGRFFREALGVDMFGKVGDAQEGHAGLPGYHTALVWGLFWPAAALIGPGLVLAWRERAVWQARFLLAWIVPAWIVFELTATKLPHYVMPLYPALAIIAARAAVSAAARRTVLTRAGAIAYGVLGLFAAGLTAGAPIVLNEGPAGPIFIASALIAAASLFIAGLFWTGRAFHGGVAAGLLAAFFIWIMMTAVLPNLSALTISPRISSALENARLHPSQEAVAPAALAGYHEPSAVFLLGEQTRLVTGAVAARELAAGRVSSAVVEQRELARFLSASENAALNPVPLSVIEGFNYSSGDHVSLTIYIRGGAD